MDTGLCVQAAEVDREPLRMAGPITTDPNLNAAEGRAAILREHLIGPTIGDLGRCHATPTQATSSVLEYQWAFVCGARCARWQRYPLKARG